MPHTPDRRPSRPGADATGGRHTSNALIERFRLHEEIRHTKAVLTGKRFVSIVTVLGVVLLTIGSTFVAAAIFLFGQNIPAHNVTSSIMGCSSTPGAVDTLVVDDTRGGTGVTFVCPPGTFGANHYAIQPLGAGSAIWHHAGLGGYNALYLIPSNTIPVAGCHQVRFPDGTLSTAWAINITASDGTLTFFDTTAYAYCTEYTHFGSYAPIYVTWSL